MKRNKPLKYAFIAATGLFVLYFLFKFNISITPRRHASPQTPLPPAALSSSHIQPKDKILVYKKEDVAALIEQHLKPIAAAATQSTPKKEIKYSYLNKYPHMLDCNDRATLNKWAPNDPNTFKPSDYTAPAHNASNEKRFVRAVLVYFPIEKANEFMGEFKWLYRSWIEMLSAEPNKWRTDLILFLDKQENLFNDKSFFLNDLNCSFSNRRSAETDKPMCTLIQYKPIAQRNFKQLTNP